MYINQGFQPDPAQNQNTGQNTAPNRAIMPAPPPAGRPAAKPSSMKIDILRSLRIHSVTAILVTLVTLGLGLAVLLRHHAVYTTVGILYVSPHAPKTLTDDRELEYAYESYVQQNVHSITRYDVLAEALRRLGPGVWRQPGESEQSAVARLQSVLEISRVGTTYEVSISLQGPRPEHLADIVNTVSKVYIEKAKNEEFYGRDDRLQTLREERDRIKAEMDAKLQEQAEITQGLGVAVVGTGGDPFDDQLGKLRTDQMTAHSQRVQAEAALSSLHGGGSPGSNPALDAAADEIIASDPGLLALKSSLNTKRTSLLEQLSGQTAANPQRKQTEGQLALIDAALQKMQSDLRKKAAAGLEQKLRTEVNRATTVENKLTSDLQRGTSAATSAAPKFQRADQLKADILRLQTRYAAVDERTSNLELESNSPGSVHVFSAALPPLGPDASKTKKYMTMLFPISLLMGLLAVVAIDLFDPRIYTAGDIESILGFAPIGVLLNEREVTQLVSDECSLRLAAGIDHAARTAGVRTFVLTGVTPGCGTTSIIENLGSTLAKLGRKTLTIDASGNTHPVAYLTIGLNQSRRKVVYPEAGYTQDFASPAPGRTSSSVVTQPIGPRITGLTSYVAQAFQDLTNEYDLVLIDAMPLLSSAESEYLARYADVTILVAEAGKTRKYQLNRAARLLEKLNVTGVAAIINKVSLIRADKAFKEDLAEFETRVTRTNLNWKPRPQTTRAGSGSNSPFDADSAVPVDEDGTYAREL